MGYSLWGHKESNTTEHSRQHEKACQVLATDGGGREIKSEGLEQSMRKLGEIDVRG